MKTKILKTGPVERRDLILNGNIVKTLMTVSYTHLALTV